MWVKENRKDVARKLAGRLVWVSADPVFPIEVWRGKPGNTYRRDEPKMTKAGKRAQKRGRVAILKLRGGRHVMHPMHVAQKAAAREVQP